jgi:hypothetical protein
VTVAAHRFSWLVARVRRRFCNKGQKQGGRLMIHIDQSVLEKVKVFAELEKTYENRVSPNDGSVAFGAKIAEWLAHRRQLQKELVDEFLPVVELLVQSGLLTASIADEGEFVKKRYASINGEVTTAFVNGNIWIEAEEVQGATERD